jgi:hypothetical protein
MLPPLESYSRACPLTFFPWTLWFSVLRNRGEKACEASSGERIELALLRRH